jgi:hypothetical protein
MKCKYFACKSSNVAILDYSGTGKRGSAMVSTALAMPEYFADYHDRRY